MSPLFRALGVGVEGSGGGYRTSPGKVAMLAFARLHRVLSDGSRGYPWGAAILVSSAVSAIYVVLPEFAPKDLAGGVDVFLLGICLGLAVGVCARVDPRVVPVACLGAVVALSVQFTRDGMPSWPAFAVAAVVGVEIAVLSYVLRLRGVVRLGSGVDVFLLVALGFGVAVGAAFLALLAVTGAGVVPLGGAAGAGRGWVLDDLFGLVCVAPALFTVRRPSGWSWNRAREFFVAVAFTAVIAWYLFVVVTPGNPGHLGWPYLVLLGPLWIAVRLGAAAVAPVSAVVFWLAAIATVNGHGVLGASAAVSQERLETVQILAIVMASTVLLVGVLRDQRLRDVTAISAAARLLREVIDGMNAYVFVKSYTPEDGPQGRYVLANQKWLDSRHMSAADLPQASPRDMFPAETVEVFVANDLRVMSVNDAIEVQEPGVGPVNEGRVFLSSKFPLRGTDGQPWGVGGVVTDVTERVVAERALAEGSELLRAVLDNSREGISRFDPHGRAEFVNSRVVELSGIPAEEWIGRTLDELGYSQPEASSWNAHVASVVARRVADVFDYRFDTPLGPRLFEATLSPEFAEDGSVAHVIATNRDITLRRQAEDELRHLATHDGLTGLANRTAILDEIALSLSAGRRSGGFTAVLMIDLDRFKAINDSLGHTVGDDLLRQAAGRITADVRAGDLVGRLGGDEFALVMRDLDDPAEALRAAWRLVEEFRTPFQLQGAEVFSTATIGVTIREAGARAEDALREADTALFVAKAEGRDRVSVFNDDLRGAVTSRFTLEGELRHALERRQLAVWYQPEVDLTTGAVIAVEALIRWHHPSGQLYTADRFIDVAEETGLILDIGPWVLREACTQAHAWATQRPDRPLTVRVNASALQLADAGLLGTLDAALEASGLDPGGLCIEITETALLRETQVVRDNLAGIRHRGIRIAVDDFGTGFASLSYLRQYPVDVLKIDRSFVTQIATDDYDRRLVAGIVSLSDSLGMTVTAEGVETLQQAAILRGLGCPGAQGFLYSRAVPPEHISALLDTEFPHP